MPLIPVMPLIEAEPPIIGQLLVSMLPDIMEPELIPLIAPGVMADIPPIPLIPLPIIEPSAMPPGTGVVGGSPEVSVPAYTPPIPWFKLDGAAGVAARSVAPGMGVMPCSMGWA
jgi:hypothetical protein